MKYANFTRLWLHSKLLLRNRESFVVNTKSKNDANHLELSKAIFIENAAANVAENASCRLGSFFELAFDPAKYFDCDTDFRKSENFMRINLVLSENEWLRLF
uniref:Uncharacterized protein n=1 Tax=Romanomermis culicivorax TaxID=13658 RepID=A0A915IP15_ROMCU